MDAGEGVILSGPEKRELGPIGTKGNMFSTRGEHRRTGVQWRELVGRSTSHRHGEKVSEGGRQPQNDDYLRASLPGSYWVKSYME